MISLAGSYDSETFSAKREGAHMRTTQNLLNEGGTATAHESNEAQPVTIGYRLGFILVYMTRAIAQLAISSAVCTRIPGVSRCFEPSSASLALSLIHI